MPIFLSLQFPLGNGTVNNNGASGPIAKVYNLV